MKTLLCAVGFFLSFSMSLAAAPPPQAAQGAAQTPSPDAPYTQADAAKRAEAYYNFTMGHLYQEFYENSNRSEYANLAIEFYKKAYALDPDSSVITERLAEIYFQSQRIRDAVLEAQAILKRDPDNLPARRLLARIYVRTLGDMRGGAESRATLGRAIEQYREILRIDPSDTEAALWLARLYRLQNQPDKAEEVLRQMLAREPESERAIQPYAQLLLDQNKSGEAIALLEKAVQRAPTPALLDLLGDAYSQVHKEADAEQAYRRALTMDPDEASHRRGLAQALLAQRKNEEALEQYKRLVELEPDDPDNYLRLAQIYRQLNQLDEAEKYVLQAKQRAPGSLEVLYNEAMIYEAQGRFNDAIRVLSDAVVGIKSQAKPMPGNERTLAILYEQLGRMYREVENYPAAINTFRELQGLGETEARQARVLIVDTYRAERDLPRALTASQEALKLYPDDRSLRITNALLLGDQGNTDQAAAELRALLGGQNDLETYLNLAQVYQQGRRFAEAEAAVHQAEQLVKQPAEKEMVSFMLGAVYERQKKYEQAEEQFKRVLVMNPRNAAVLNYYGYMLADRGIRLEEATALIQRALDEDPHEGAYLDSLGWAYYKQNRLPEAEAMLRKAVARLGHDPTILGHLGDVYFKSGQVGLAASTWERALEEWKHALPTEADPEKVAELQDKLAQLKQRLAQQKTDGEAKPR